ncbi:hypothetical protein EH32_00370 [Erythrobacter litoralis]|uniref:Uncharacterized protein n=1 Tax=Erythrobacter litoralis TaxID=39960 RepID=A0A074MFJ0_9SPHN|nr:hypothetical protein EH32_00370 [Erythrobacter litoralis]
MGFEVEGLGSGFQAALPHRPYRRRFESENDGAQQIGIRTGEGEHDAGRGGAFHHTGSDLEQPQLQGW